MIEEPNPFAIAVSRHTYGFRKAVSAIRWTCDGRRLVTAGDKSALRVFDLDRVSLRDQTHESDGQFFTGHKDEVIEQVASHPHDFNVFATAGHDQRVHVYDLRQGPGPIKRFSTNNPNVTMHWSPNGKTLAIGDSADAIYMLDVHSHAESHLKPADQCDFEVNQVRWDQTGSQLYLVCGDGNIVVKNAKTMDTAYTFGGHRDRCFAIALNPRHSLLAVASLDCTVSVWDADIPACSFVIDRPESGVRSVDYSHNGDYLASGTSSGRIDITRAGSGAQLHAVRGDVGVVDLQWNPKSMLLAYCVEEEFPRSQSAAMPLPPRGYPSLGPPPILPRAFVFGFSRPQGANQMRNATRPSR